MKLGEIIRNVERLDNSLTICAARTPKWTAESEAELSPSPLRAEGCRLPYFLEVGVAKNVLRAWSFARGGAVPSDKDRCRAIIYYAENDAYLLPEHEKSGSTDMPDEWTIQWRDSEPHPVESAERLNQILDELSTTHDSQHPILVQLRAPSGEVLMIGIGGELNVLDHIAAAGWPAQHSLGDPDAEGTIPYRMGSYDSEMPKAYAIPSTLARRAIEHFFRTGTLLADVRWEED